MYFGGASYVISVRAHLPRPRIISLLTSTSTPFLSSQLPSIFDLGPNTKLTIPYFLSECCTVLRYQNFIRYYFPSPRHPSSLETRKTAMHPASYIKILIRTLRSLILIQQSQLPTFTRPCIPIIRQIRTNLNLIILLQQASYR